MASGIDVLYRQWMGSPDTYSSPQSIENNKPKPPLLVVTDFDTKLILDQFVKETFTRS